MSKRPFVKKLVHLTVKLLTLANLLTAMECAPFFDLLHVRILLLTFHHLSHIYIALLEKMVPILYFARNL